MDGFHRLLGDTAAARLVRARERQLEEQRGAMGLPALLRTLDGVDYINDGASTHIDATLRTMADLERPVIWIAGALDAAIGQPHVTEFLRDHVAALVLFGKRAGHGIDALKPFTAHLYTADELRTAVFLARELARSGEVVLFSPACPAGNTHADTDARNNEFLNAVNDL